MDIVKISNIFNGLTQLHPTLKYYHCGLHSTVNQNGIPNNFDPSNIVGVEYPFLLFPYPVITVSKALMTQRQITNLTVELDFYDTMFYGNDSKNNTRSEIEIFRDLEVVADDILTAFKKAANEERKADKCNNISIADQVSYEYVPFAHNNRLACIRATFALEYFTPCSTFDPDFSLLPAETPIPTLTYDYEDLGHKVDSV